MSLHIRHLPEPSGMNRLPPMRDVAIPADSAARRLLVDLLERYLRDELPGRSVLVGGDRGSGKTMMVHHALRSVTFEASDRRLLPVTLYGPSLLARAEKAALKAAVPAPSPASPAGVPGAPPGPPVAPPREPADVLMEVLVKALHHAVLHEMIRAMGVEVQHLHPSAQEERAEIAEQLRVDMMRSAIHLSRLRLWWEAGGAMPHGVLFPQAGKYRGAREVSACWGLSQGYMMISGTLEQARKQTDQAEEERRQRTEQTIRGSDYMNPLLGILSGGLMAAGVYQVSPLLASVAAVSSAVSTTTVLNWTTDRIRKSSDVSSLEFKEDLRSSRALPRWLPHILQQLRDIGLYPMFLVDEIDKFSEEELDYFRDSIRRLKGIFQDNAFFVFLTGQDSFEHLSGPLSEEVHSDLAQGLLETLFTDRLFVSHRPSELRSFTTNLAVPASDPAAYARWRRWAPILVFRARSHPFHLKEVLHQYIDAAASLWNRDQELTPVFQAELLYQLALEQVLEHGALGLAVATDPQFLQAALQALYYPARKWEMGEELLSWSEADLRADLLQRKIDVPRPRSFKLLVQGVESLCRLLENPKELHLDPAVDELVTGAPPLLARQAEGGWRWLVGVQRL
ncbi:MAG TPA: hypothetical protein PKW90_05810 [Myxococcota bacterium]|nr:hypothetical protein [Myxococcota bacterium]